MRTERKTGERIEGKFLPLFPNFMGEERYGMIMPYKRIRLKKEIYRKHRNTLSHIPHT